MRQGTLKKVNLGSAERIKLEGLCRNRLNWSDGGRWLGTGKAPNCYIKDRHTSTHSHTYNFLTDEASTKWNLEWEKNIRHIGHMGTAALTAALTLVSGGTAGIVVGTLAAIAKDELQAGVDYPRMARGGSYEVIFKHEFQWSPQPTLGYLIMTITTIARDFEGKITRELQGSKKYQLKELPDGLARKLAMTPPRKTSSEFK